MIQLVSILQIVGAIWVISSVLKRPDKTSEHRLIWIIAAIMFGIITAIAYYLLEYKKFNN
ncbi:MAG: PLDc N-terminal domain-containing protein [Bacteroidales bacterium]